MLAVDTLKLAIVGMGRMGALHARTLAKVPEIELVAVVDDRQETVGPPLSREPVKPISGPRWRGVSGLFRLAGLSAEATRPIWTSDVAALMAGSRWS